MDHKFAPLRRILSLCMAAVLLITFMVPASAASFEDLGSIVQVDGSGYESPSDGWDDDGNDDDVQHPDPNDGADPDDRGSSSGGSGSSSWWGDDNDDPADPAPDDTEPDKTEPTDPDAEPNNAVEAGAEAAAAAQETELSLGASGISISFEASFGTSAGASSRATASSTTIYMTSDNFITHRYPFSGGTSYFPAYIFTTASGEAVYCIEPSKFNSTNNTVVTGSETWDSLSLDKQRQIARAIAANSSGASNRANYVATQAIIWEIAYGQTHRGGSVYSAVIAANSSQLSSAYESILSRMSEIGDVPSFMSKNANNPTVHQMNESGGSWSITLTNSTSGITLRESDFKTRASMNFSVSGNSLTVTTNSAPTSDAYVQWDSATDAGLVFWKSNEQGKASLKSTSVPGTGYMAFNPDFEPFEEDPDPEPVLGYLQINKYDGETNLPLGGAIFRVEAENFINDSFAVPYGGATIVIPIPEGKDSVEVTVTEVSAPFNYQLDPTPQTVTVYDNTIVNLSYVAFDNYPLECSLRIYKYEKGNYSIPVAGAKFRIRYADINVSAQTWERTTDANGYISISPLPAAGTLVIEELESGAGYVIGAESVWTVTVAPGEDKQVDISNDKLAQMIVYKKDSVTKTLLANATFRATLLRSHTEPYESGMVYTATTDANGEAKFENLIPGEYRVEEVSPPPFYLPTTQVETVNVYDGSTETVTLSFENDRFSGLTIVKVDSVTGQRLQGAVFALYRGTEAYPTQFLGDYQTNENGMVIITDLPTDEWHTVVEKQAPYAYELSEENTKTVYLKAEDLDQNITLYFRNPPKPKLLIVKEDTSGNRLYNVTFRVSKEDSSEYMEFHTDHNGEILIENLEATWYTIWETRTADGHLISDEKKTVTLEVGKTIPVVFQNAKLPSLVLRKVDALTGAGIPGVTLRVTKEGQMEHTDVVTGRNGEIKLPNLTPGVYTAVEVSTLPNYILDDTPQSIELKADSGDNVLVFRNHQKPTLTLRKIDANSGEGLAGVTLRITKEGAAEYTDVVTGPNGEVVVKNLMPSWYIVHEIATLPSYILDETPQYIELKADTHDNVLTFQNKRRPSLTIKKVCSVTGNPLQATFEIKVKNGRTLGSFTTDPDTGIVVIEDLEYTSDPLILEITEKIPPTGYLITQETLEVSIKWNEDRVIEWPNEPENPILIYKTDKDGNPVPNVTFLVTTVNGAYVGEYKTGERSGVAVVPGLEPGFYMVREIRTSDDSWILDETPRLVELRVGSPAVVEVVNHKRPTLQLQKEDQDGNPLQGVKIRIQHMNGAVVGDFYTSEAGLIDVVLDPGWYTCFELETLPGMVLDSTPQNIELKADGHGILRFKNYSLPGFQIQKVDAITQEPMENVEMTITKLDGGHLGTYRTNHQGIIFIDDITEKYIVVTETKTLDGYKIDSQPRTVELIEGQLVKLRWENTPWPVLIIEKVDKESGKPIPNTQIKVFDKLQRELGIFTTNDLGQIILTGMEEGRYYVQEYKAADTYVLDSTVRQIDVYYGKTSRLRLENVKMGTFRLRKIDKDTKEPLSGAVFLLYDAKNNVLGEYTTNAYGIIEFPDSIEPQKLKIKEIKAPSSDYVLDDTLHEFEVKAGETFELVLENRQAKGQIQIVKKAADDNSITKDKKGALLADAVFEIYNDRLEVVDRIRTDKRGVATSKGLPLGKYAIKEVSSPDFYWTDGKEFYAEIKLDGDLIRFEVFNEPAEVEVTVQKRGNVEAMPGDQIIYNFSSIANESNVPLMDFYWHDQIPVDAVRLNQIHTGTWSERLTYSVTYRTNLKTGYRTLEKNLSSKTDNVLECGREALGLAANEYITDIRFEFGEVGAGFHCVDDPWMIVTVLADLPDGYQFTNRTTVGGRLEKEWITAKDAWTTVIFAPPRGKLPKTGFGS